MKLLRYFTFLGTMSLISGIYFTFTADLNSDTKLSSEILDLYLGFRKFTVEKVDSHTSVSPNRG